MNFTLITSNNNLSTGIDHRLQIANSYYLGLRNQLWSQWTRRNAKLKQYKKLTRAILPYGCETYVSNKSDPKQDWKISMKSFSGVYMAQ
jgi:hypothetical protein